jgi:hypothetical protein
VPDARDIGDSLVARGVKLSLGGTSYYRDRQHLPWAPTEGHPGSQMSALIFDP